jgi:flagellar biosynthesis protein FlhF
MNLQTFKAPTMADALKQVKTTLGGEAVILHTRTYKQSKWLGLRRQEIVEITAGKGLGVGARPRKVEVPPRVIPTARPNMIDAGRQILQSPAGSGVAIMALAQDVTTLKTMMKDLVDENRHRQAPHVPQELFEYYQQLISNQVATALASDIVKNVQKQIRTEHLSQPQFVRDKIAEQLEKLMPMSGPIKRTKTDGPHVVALIGPTGVGKTTTIAKLAANLKLRDKQKVGLITIDTYRIAAIEQLKKYADILGSPLKVVGTPDELREGIRSMRGYEFVLVDTAGRSPNDTLKLNELKMFLRAATPDEVHLVLSSTASQECAELAISKFADVRTDKIIFTKLDEAARVGVVLNTIHKVNKSLSYVTTGQDVPDDIEVGRGRRLAQLIMGAAL